MNTNTAKLSLVSHSEEITKDLGAAVARQIEDQSVAANPNQLDQARPVGWTVFLSGTLGSGKTRFAQGFLAGLGVEQIVVSPTFVLQISYLVDRRRIAHLDLYRIEHVEELDELGLDEQLDEGSVLLIEWAEKFANALPPPDLSISLVVTGDQTREIGLLAQSPQGQTLLSRLRGP